MSALTSLLVRDGVVPVRKIEEALQRQVISGGDVETVLLEMGAVQENILNSYRAAVYELAPVSRDRVMEVPSDVLRLVPAEVAKEHRLIPLSVEGRALHVAVHEPLSLEKEEQIAFLLGFDLVPHIACEVRIAAALGSHYGVELIPRMARLVRKVEKQPAGDLVDVGPVAPGRLTAHVADIPSKAPHAVDLGPRQSGMFIAPEPDPEPAAAPELPPHAIVETPIPPRPVATPAPAPEAHPDDGGPATVRELKRLRGPVTLAAGERLLKRAADRDEIIEVLFGFAVQFFDYTALFVVSDESADGRAAHGPGASTAQVLGLSFPLDRDGLFAEVRRTRAPQVRRLDRTESDRDVAVGLRRPAAPPALVMPIAIRQRVVLLLYGDRNGEDFDVGAVMELVRFGPRVVEALEQLILRRKRKGYHDDAAPKAEAPAEERDELKAAAKSVARTAGSQRPPRPAVNSGEWQPGNRTNPGFAPPTSTSGDSWSSVEHAPQKVTGEEPPHRAELRRARREEMQFAPGLDASRLPSDAPPSTVLGIPRRAPPPPAARDSLLPALGGKTAAFGEDDEDEITIEAGDDEDEDEVTLEVGGDDEDEDEVTLEVGDDDDDEDEDDEDGGEVTLEVGDDDDDDDDDEDDEDEDDEEEEDEEGETAGGELQQIDPASKPGRARIEGVYKMSDAAVDVVRPSRPPRAVSDRAPRASDRPASPSKPAPRVEKATPKPEVVRVPDSIETNRRSSRPPRGMDAASRSVIVDMGDQVHGQVEDLLEARSLAEQDRKIEDLIAIGDVALPVLAQAFPGPLVWTRDERGPMPRGRDLSPVARAFVAYRERAVPYVASLLSSAHPDVRFYAILVAAELVHPELMDAVAERIHDVDDGVRDIAIQLLPSFVAMPGFEEIRTVVRRTARIRGRDLTRRHQAVDAIASLRDVAMIPKLIELLREDDDILIDHLVRALRQLAAQDFGSSHKKWSAWYERHRNEHRIEWLIEGLLHAEEEVRRVAGEEIKRATQEYYGYHHGSPKRDRERVAKKYRDWWEAHRERA